MFRQWVAVVAVGLVVATPAPAWNGTGHRIIAAIAYDRLKPAARRSVDELIHRHPDYQAIFLKDAPSDPARRARWAFMNASVWPDIIRSDPRFYSEDRSDSIPTPVLPGFPDMGRHARWHFVNLPFSQDGTRPRQAALPNVVSELERLLKIVDRPISDPANPVYALPWILHLVGDIHNPLHTVQRYSREFPNGDQGGNLVFVDGGRTLHSYWDSLAGPDSANMGIVEGQVQQITQLRIEPGSLKPSKWAAEGAEMANRDVYTFGPQNGSRERPLILTAPYKERAKNLYLNKLALAGERLAALLNRLF
ncbi:MAG: S1/P1 nuclease [Acidobacteriota bacterium]